MIKKQLIKFIFMSIVSFRKKSKGETIASDKQNERIILSRIPTSFGNSNIEQKYPGKNKTNTNPNTALNMSSITILMRFIWNINIFLWYSISFY